MNADGEDDPIGAAITDAVIRTGLGAAQETVTARLLEIYRCIQA